MDIGFDQYSMTLDGERTFVRSGAMHYFRLPHPGLWRDRLEKLKAAGYNTVDIYFNWDFHSKAPGQYDFTGARDVKLLLEMIQEVGLYLIARPGPYINAETTRGGLPGWLLMQPDVILRNRIDGAYQYSPQYMAFVREWYDQILPFIKTQPNLIMIQIENEYATDDMEPDYMQELLQIVRDHGITVPSMHNDFYAAGLYADVVDIYAVDNYSVTAFDWDWRTFPDLFSVIDHLENNLRPEFCPNRPLMMAELQAGWFAGWKSVSYQKIHESLGRDHIGLVTRSFLGQGGTIFNHYKAIGGTNWEHLGATDAYTSYDFSAPIAEWGGPTERLYEAKRINLLLSHFDLSQTERVMPEAIDLTPSPTFYTLRQNHAAAGGYWLFTRNITNTAQGIDLPCGLKIHTAPFQSKIIPYQLTLQNGWQLEAINVEPLAQTNRCLIVPSTEETSLIIKVPQPLPAAQQGNITANITDLGDNTYHIELTNPLQPDQLTWVRWSDYTVYFLGQAYIDRLWAIGNDTFLLGPDLVTAPDQAWLSEKRSVYILSPDGELEPMSLPVLDAPALPALDYWHVLPGLDQLEDPSGYQAISSRGSDMDSNGFHEGAAWYRYEFNGKAQTLSIHAQHIWAIFLNGHCILESHTFHVYPEVGGPEDMMTLQLPQDLQKDNDTNSLVIFVESLGHHKGFYDDAREPRGVLKLLLDGREIQQDGSIKPARLALGIDDISTDTASTHAPILHTVTDFHLNLPDDQYTPIGLFMDLDLERVDIRLNGILVGKYWRSCKNQTLFYLPEGILNCQGNNRLELVLMNFLPRHTIEKSFPMAYGKVRLQAFRAFSKLCAKPVDSIPSVSVK